MSVKIDIHADDFGESLHASRDILECLKDGKLNSISVLANMSCFEAVSYTHLTLPTKA